MENTRLTGMATRASVQASRDLAGTDDVVADTGKTHTKSSQKRTLDNANGKSFSSQVEEHWKTEIRPELEKNKRSCHSRKKEFVAMATANPQILDRSAKAIVDMLVARTPLLKETGRLRPDWDHVLKDINPPYGHHRRHVVMSSPMRMATYKMCDLAKNAPPDLAKGFFDEMARIVSEHENRIGREVKVPGGESLSPETLLESKLVSIMHNHKTNIFMGRGSWNSMIGGMAHKLNEIEQEFAQKVSSAQSRNDLKVVADEWLTALRGASVFGNRAQHQVVLNVYTEMIQRVFGDFDLIQDVKAGNPIDASRRADLAWDGMGTGSLAEFKENLLEIFSGCSDTMASDISEAGNANSPNPGSADMLRKSQNGSFALNRIFVDFSRASFAPSDRQAFVQAGTVFLNNCRSFIEREATDLAGVGISQKSLYSDILVERLPEAALLRTAMLPSKA